MTKRRSLLSYRWTPLAFVFWFLYVNFRLTRELVEFSSARYGTLGNFRPGEEPPLSHVTPPSLLALPDIPPNPSVSEDYSEIMVNINETSRMRPMLLQQKLDGYHKAMGKPYDQNLWKISDYVPGWMKGEGG